MTSPIFSKVDHDKACRFEGINSNVLKLCARELTPVLCKCFNRSMVTSSFPVGWMSTSTVALLKKSGKHSRPICLFSVYCRVIETFVIDNSFKLLNSKYKL